MVSMDKLVSLCKRRGFIFPSSEIYGGLSGCWDYGPMGVELKRNIKVAWWEDMIGSHDQTDVPPGAPTAFDMVGLDCSILMNSSVWEASGHVGGFNDPMVDCRETKTRYRADQLAVFRMEPFEGDAAGGDQMLFAAPGEAGVTPDEDLIATHRKRIKSITRKGGDFRLVAVPDALEDDDLRARVLAPGASEPGTLTAPRAFNLMFETHVGALKDNSNVAYLRPETAQGIFVNFKNVCDTARVRVPFGIGQIGKAFRNEITTGNFTFRSREFEQMVLEYFVEPGQDGAAFTTWVDERFAWWQEFGLDPSRLRLRPHDADELSHYSKATTDIEYEFPFGWGDRKSVV